MPITNYTDPAQFGHGGGMKKKKGAHFRVLDVHPDDLGC